MNRTAKTSFAVHKINTISRTFSAGKVDSYGGKQSQKGKTDFLLSFEGTDIVNISSVIYILLW